MHRIIKTHRKTLFFPILLAIAVLTLILLIRPQSDDLSCKKCNVILVSLDTLSSLHLPCYGYSRNTAPNLCEFAKKNWLFENSYSQSTYTLPSHFSIFTSLYPHTHKMVDVLKGYLDEEYLTLAQVLRSNGYHTTYDGPLNDIHLPLNRGLERGFSILEHNKINNWKIQLERLEKNNKNGISSFLFLHSYAVHDPYLTGNKKKHLFTSVPVNPVYPLTEDEYYEPNDSLFPFCADFILADPKIGPGYTAALQYNRELAELIHATKNNTKKKELFYKMTGMAQSICLTSWRMSQVNLTDSNEVEYLKALYDEQISSLDVQLKELFKFVARPEIAKNTILILTADHGEEFMEHGQIAHSHNLYRTSTAVPLIMYVPNSKPRKITEMVQGIDIYPTVLSIIGLEPLSSIEGISLKSIMLNHENPQKNIFLLSEYFNLVGIQKDDWRFYYDKNDKKFTDLYNTKEDPLEQKNLIEKFPKKARDLLDLPITTAKN